MLERFKGSERKKHLVTVLKEQKIINGAEALATGIVDIAELKEYGSFTF